MPNASKHATATVLTAAFLSLSVAGARAETCSSEIVAVQGEPSSFEWLAKTKARANWRSRVRVTKVLGTAYSTWSLAQDRTENCAKTTRGTVCVFAGRPCKP